MKTERFRAALLGTCCALSLMTAGTAALAAPTSRLSYGVTAVDLSDTFVSALSSLKVEVSPRRPARLSGTQARFPIPGGVLDLENAKGEILHLGGLQLSAGGTVVQLINFIIDTSGTAPVLTGNVIANGNYVGRLPLFDIKLPALTLPLAPRNKVLSLSGAELTLSAGAADALNSVFNINNFTAGLPIGTATTRTVGRLTK